MRFWRESHSSDGMSFPVRRVRKHMCYFHVSLLVMITWEDDEVKVMSARFLSPLKNSCVSFYN